MLSRYVIYILMFAVLGAVLYAWGLKKAQSQSQELARMLYAKCCKIVKKELKKKEYLRKNEIEQLIRLGKDAAQIISRINSFTVKIRWV